jgi:ABC-type multidrug transport system fused ATPase/permease subunit
MNQVFMIDQGSVVESGSYKDLMTNKGQVYALLSEFGKRIKEEPISRANSEILNSEVLPVTSAVTPATISTINEPEKSKLISTEDLAQGSVSWSVYSTYAKACSYSSVIIFLLISVTSQALSVSQNVYLSQWAAFNDKIQDQPEVNPNLFIWLGFYGLLGLCYSTSVVIQVIYIWVFCGIRSARLLHNQMLGNVIHCPQSFFDTTPLGRILNRFSKDQYTVDEVLPRSFQAYFRTLFNVISVLAVNAIGSPYYILFAVPLGYLYGYFQQFYLSTSRELKRLVSSLV